jgi:PLP dependent protein
MSSILNNVWEIRKQLADAAAAAGRDPGEIRLVAVSKTFPPEAVFEAVAAGQLCFGENRVQEAESKIAALKDHAGLEWHLIGHLQTNKARRAAELFDLIHSVDSIKLAERLNQTCHEYGKILPVLIQVDLGLEPTKFGAEAGQVRELVHAASEMKGLRLNGLMTLPPYFDDPELAAPFFRKLRELRDELEAWKPGCLGEQELSMGMSHDFAVAIREGATIVRIGTAIFGGRVYA